MFSVFNFFFNMFSLIYVDVNGLFQISNDHNIEIKWWIDKIIVLWCF